MFAVCAVAADVRTTLRICFLSIKSKYLLHLWGGSEKNLIFWRAHLSRSCTIRPVMKIRGRGTGNLDHEPRIINLSVASAKMSNCIEAYYYSKEYSKDLCLEYTCVIAQMSNE